MNLIDLFAMLVYPRKLREFLRSFEPSKNSGMYDTAACALSFKFFEKEDYVRMRNDGLRSKLDIVEPILLLVR